MKPKSKNSKVIKGFIPKATTNVDMLVDYVNRTVANKFSRDLRIIVREIEGNNQEIWAEFWLRDGRRITTDKIIRPKLWLQAEENFGELGNLIYGFYQEITEKLSKGYHPQKVAEK